MSKGKFFSIIITLLFGAGTIHFINQGFQHVFPQNMLRYAGQNWQDGHFSGSIRWFANANVSAFHVGVRWTIAGFYLQQMRRFLEQEELIKGLEHCSQAVKILKGYDDEGAVSYSCTVIEEKIKRQK